MKHLFACLLGVACLAIAFDASAFRDQAQQQVIDKAMKEKKSHSAKAPEPPVTGASSVAARSGHP